MSRMGAITRTGKALVAITKRVGLALSPIFGTRGTGWFPWVREPYAGAWQRNDGMTVETQLAHAAVYACVTLISNDFGKMRQKLVERTGGIKGVWQETRDAVFSTFFRKPNRYQNGVQFRQWWATSKLTRGNVYALKQRELGVVVAAYILNPDLVTPLVTPDGTVYYRLGADNLAGITDTDLIVPSSEIFHDRMNCLFHPLVGVSPLYASGLAAAQGLAIQNTSRTFFGNGARPSGVLTAPGAIDPETAARLKAQWDEKFTGDNAGKVAVLGAGLRYEPMSMMSASESQLIEQLNWTAENVCMAFHVPPWKIGHGQQPTYQNGELLNQQYYDACLGSLIEEYESCMDEGLGIGEGVVVGGRELGVELDEDTLLRLDSAALHLRVREDLKGSVITLNEARNRLNLPPIEGGDVIWMQEQMHSMDSLLERDRSNPFPSSGDTQSTSDVEVADEEEPTAERALALLNAKAPESLAHA